MKDLTYKVITKKLPSEAKNWCTKNIGEQWFAVGRKTGNWTMFWAGINARKDYIWYFRYEKDATWFSLRWL